MIHSNEHPLLRAADQALALLLAFIDQKPALQNLKAQGTVLDTGATFDTTVGEVVSFLSDSLRDARSEGLLAGRLPKHAGELVLNHNEHTTCYQTVAKYLAELRQLVGEEDEGYWESSEMRAKAEETNELWELIWYPDTPVAFRRVMAPTLQDLLRFANNIEINYGV